MVALLGFKLGVSNVGNPAEYHKLFE